MAQISHVDVGATPTDITSGLDDGCYVAQVGDREAGRFVPVDDGLGVLYASAASAPTDTADYFHCRPGDFFTFTVTATSGPVWAMSATGVSIVVALAMQ